MRKAMWMEVLEWCVLAVVVLFVSGAFAMRAELTSNEPENPVAPIHSLDE
jgi:hypothetical protein